MRDPDADPARDRARLRAAAMMAGMGIAHFLVPGPFRRIVPRWFPWRREAVMVSGVAEIASGALLAIPRTRRAGGWLMLLTVLAVYPANVQMAIDASRGRSQVRVPVWLTWLRLPLQLPMLARAWSFTR
ncbi:MAG: hypothetical protein EKK62_01050 [Acidimicrobiia bacterium]|nr:hypothetical protein [Microthrixaceae bacterium]RTL09650.1 MAG: hypothetical protein EKK62_01050 [Acidimicrobiia bacterium]